MSEPSKRLTLPELEETLEYQKLTPKQRLFVATYCAGGLADGKYDAVAATMTAYQCKSIEVARIMSYSMLQNIRIIAVLNRHFQTEPIEDFLVQLDHAINNKRLTVAQVTALKIKCEILGFGNRLPSSLGGAAIHEARDAEKKERKSKRKVYTPKPEAKSQYDDH